VAKKHISEFGSPSAVAARFSADHPITKRMVKWLQGGVRLYLPTELFGKARIQEFQEFRSCRMGSDFRLVDGSEFLTIQQLVFCRQTRRCRKNW
jgi:hypothetical protein